MEKKQTLRVDLGARGYDIHVGPGLLGQAGDLIAPVLRHRRVFIVTDEPVAKLHLAALERALSSSGIAFDAFVLPTGEETKSFEHLERLVERLLEHRIERRDALIALGGGVVGDLTGFAAAVTLRGLDLVQIPTTLLAQVDSSVGGKTGINSRHGKNLVGAFHQPRLVLADTDAMETLPRRQLLAGYAEVVKYGCINDAAFFAWLETNGLDVLEGRDRARRHAVLTSCRRKAEIVAKDETESSGERALLNLGHTFAHAIEAECEYSGEVLHGEAVAIGMVLAADLSAELGYCSTQDAARIRNHLAAVGLPTNPSHAGNRLFSPQRLLDHMSRDKKVHDGKIGFVLLRGIGSAFVSRDVPREAVSTVLADALAV